MFHNVWDPFVCLLVCYVFNFWGLEIKIAPDAKYELKSGGYWEMRAHWTWKNCLRNWHLRPSHTVWTSLTQKCSIPDSYFSPGILAQEVFIKFLQWSRQEEYFPIVVLVLSLSCFTVLPQLGIPQALPFYLFALKTQVYVALLVKGKYQ